MAEPWLAIIGLGEDGLDGLSRAARAMLDRAETIFGGPRHLELVAAGARGHAWPVPFDIAPVLALKGRPVVVLASGDPFWHGAGGSLSRQLGPDEWRAFPAPSTFSLAAARLGWQLEEVSCLGLHAAPFAQLRPHLAPGARILCLIRDAAAAPELAAWLVAEGFGASRLWQMEALGGPRERISPTRAEDFTVPEGHAPLAIAIEAAGGPGLSRASGLNDGLFNHDGQITKRPVRALTLSALAPRAGEHLWDIGLGSGSVAMEWLLAAPRSRATGIEADPTRAARARANAARFGLERQLNVIEARAPEELGGLAPPDAVFIGGGVSEPLLTRLWALMPAGCRLVANAVTLESEALLIDWSGRRGGGLLKIELAMAEPLGPRRGWDRARPILQWSVVR